MSKLADQIHITIDEFTQRVIFYDLKLSQRMMDHHDFSFVWQHSGRAIIPPDEQAKALRKFSGKEVIFIFKNTAGDIKLMSKGIITELKSIDENGSPVGLHVSGVSHTILLDDLPKSRVFLDKSIKEIALKIFGDETAGEFYQRDAIQPTFKQIFEYKPQYNETSFDFLKRLSARYGQWFYFDGMRIQLGQLKTSKVKLINYSSLHQFTIKSKLFSHKTSLVGYDYNSASGLRNSKAFTSTGSADSFSAVARDRQFSVSQPDLSAGIYTNQAQNASEIEEMVKLQSAGRDANSTLYSGVSYLPIGIGQIFTIENQTVHHELIAIEVTHYGEVHGNYKCEFKAIPADAEAPHYTNVHAYAKAECQPAIVQDNNDPEGLGRVRVNYYWGGGSSLTEWMRVIQPYSGTSRGMYWRPEIGDEVLVNFENGNIDHPYVSGSHYNGKATPEFFDAQNSIKGWRLRYGQLLKFIEKVGIWLSDPSGNELHMNEKTKSTTITVPETLTLNCKNLIINASESITTTAGMNISETAGVDKSTTVGVMNALNVGGNSMLNVTGDLFESIDGDFHSEAKQNRNTIGHSGIISQSENTEFHSEKDIQNNSTEDTRQN